MKIDKRKNIHVNRLLLVSIAILIGLAGWFFWHNRKDSHSSPRTGEAYYLCYLRDGGARCNNKDNPAGCLPHYPLRDKGPQGGIVIPKGDIVATCEGFIGPYDAYYDKDGNYVSQ